MNKGKIVLTWAGFLLLSMIYADRGILILIVDLWLLICKVCSKHEIIRLFILVESDLKARVAEVAKYDKVWYNI